MIHTRIPKKVHYVWLGESTLPSRFKKNVDSWKYYNPDYELICWGNESLDLSDPFIAAAFNQKAWAKLSDLVRLTAVYNHGGIYLDTDVEVRRPFDPLLSSECFFGYQSLRDTDDPICNAVFGAISGHWFINKVLETFPRVSTENINSASTGPELVSSLLVDLGLPLGNDERVNVSGVDVFPIHTFYPYHWEEEFSEKCVAESTYTIHHWDMSWHHHGEFFLIRKIREILKNNPRSQKIVKIVYRYILYILRKRVNQR